MKTLKSITLGALLLVAPLASAQTDFNFWLSTDGAGIQINSSPRGYFFAPPPPPRYHAGPRHYRHYNKKAYKKYKKMRKAQRKYYKSVRDFYDFRSYGPRPRHHHHHDWDDD